MAFMYGDRMAWTSMGAPNHEAQAFKTATIERVLDFEL